ncbi:glycoside hydrolase family 95-like protein [Paenibacillus sp. 32352]|uniref:glycosyl hydrolase family 95 catalytic domain-containing protein n=1 Tax=Paenibacillus sp. 32352 TaxID=1969111 RepID=UPI0009AC1EF5|nr:hypothetical protein [Paenibacillus sp. 32352]
MNQLPWQGYLPLKDMAKQVQIRRTLHPTCPQPQAAWSMDSKLYLNHPSIKAALWGPPEQITLSMIKSDVFDRRIADPPVLTLKELREGAYSQANEGFLDIQPSGNTRPKYGSLDPRGGRREPYAAFRAYPFPCQKPVGQIIVRCNDFQGCDPVQTVQQCSSGLTSSTLVHGKASLQLDVLLSMKRSVIAMRTEFSGLSYPLSFRLYRHRDQAHRMYMNAEGTEFKPMEERQPVYLPRGSAQPVEYYHYERDAAWNGPIEPPESGSEGRFFWIRQRLPAEKTFPDGFEYVVMGLVNGSDAELETVENGFGLGTPPYADEGWTFHEKDYARIRQAPGAAATAALNRLSSGQATLYTVVVTSNDAADIMEFAKRQLLEAETDGFEALLKENTDWYDALYDKREHGRVLYPGDSYYEKEITHLFNSWACKHSGGCRTDSRKFEASASYAGIETDVQPWHSLPCYNELFYTPMVVRSREDALDMWWQLVEHWLPAARKNASEVYGLPGMILVHGYLPPVKPDRYVHTNSTLELCLETGAQVLKVLWDMWDYAADEALMQRLLYPALRDLAIFYLSYLELQEDGHFHIVPAVEAESWGIQPKFEYNRDTISAISMFRWTFHRAAELADYLGTDPNLKADWLHAANNLPPYPTYETEEGLIYAGVPGIKPRWSKGCHPWYIGVYPTTLADEINLDSSPKEKEIMLRTVRSVPAGHNRPVYVLLGECKDRFPTVDGVHPRTIETYADLCIAINEDPERVINSRSGRIHLFPVVPDWAEISFRRFQARGGFWVSASRTSAGVAFVEIEARRSTLCRIMNPWPGEDITVVEINTGDLIDFKVDRAEQECILFEAEKGKTYRLVKV